MVLAENSYSPGPTKGRVRNKPVRRSKPRNKPRKKGLIYIKVVALILCCFGFGIYYTHMNHQLTALGYRVEEQKDKVAMLQRDYKQLELEAAELQCPDRVEDVAVNKLGMNKPDSVLYAALPNEDKTDSNQKQVTDNQGQDENSWSLAIQSLINRAEASPR